MTPGHLALCILITAVWGFNFIAIKFGVGEAQPFFLTAVRFLFAAIPAIFFIPRPKEGWKWVAGFGAMLGIGQFGFLFLAVRLGLPIGLTSLVMQLQAFFTVGFVWALTGEKPLPRQMFGAAVAFLGIAVIAYARWKGSDGLPLLLCVIAAAGWALANVISKMARPANTLSFVIWSSLAVPVPMMVLSLLFENQAQNLAVLAHPSMSLLLSLAYLVFASTIFGYAAWNFLFNHYTAATIAPFSMLIPVFGILGGAMVFQERFTPPEWAGGALIAAGLIISNFAKKKAKPESFA